MIAVDTNVLVRLLTGDQAAAARSLFMSESIWIAKTVLLETDWVLRSLYRSEASAVHDALTRVLGLENVHAEDERRSRRPWRWRSTEWNSPTLCI